MGVVQSRSSTLPWIDEETLVECISGKTRLEWHREVIPLRLSALEMREYVRARERGFCVGRARGESLFWAYGYWCELRGRPTVKVELRRKYAAVKLDMITANHDLCEHKEARIRQAALLASLDESGASCWLEGNYFSFDGLLPDRARALASVLWRIVSAPCASCAGQEQGGW